MSLHFSDIQVKIFWCEFKMNSRKHLYRPEGWLGGWTCLFCDHHERQFVCLFLTDQLFGGSKGEMYLNMLFRNLVIPWVDKVHPEKSRLSRVKSCALSHIIISILLMKIVGGFFGRGDRTAESRAKLSSSSAITTDDCQHCSSSVEALLAAFRDHIHRSVFFFHCPEEFQVFTNASSLLHTDTSLWLSISRRLRRLVLTFPVPYMGTVWELIKLLQ